MIMVAAPPPGISPFPSATTHRPPSDRTVSVPWHFSAGCSCPAIWASDVHSPMSLCSHWCSFCGSTFITSSPSLFIGFLLLYRLVERREPKSTDCRRRVSGVSQRQLAQPPLQESPFRRLAREFQGLAVGDTGLLAS